MMNKKILAIIIAVGFVGTIVTSNAFGAVEDLSYVNISKILKIVKQNNALLLHPDFGLAEIKREVRNIEGNITDPTFGLEEIKTEIRDIQTDIDTILEEIQNLSGNGGQITTAFKDFESPFDVSNTVAIHIPEEVNGTLEEASCIVKDSGAWIDGGSLNVVVNIVDVNNTSTNICTINNATQTTSSFNDGINLALAGGEDIKISCTSVGISDPDFTGCSVEIDLWMKLQND